MQLRLGERPLPPVPSGERDAFGHYLSGLVDGEGSFLIGKRRNRLARHGTSWRIAFRIALRADDREVLERARAFLDAGRIRSRCIRHQGRDKTYEAVELQVDDLCGLRRLVKHFDRYPLRAKKARDYSIWRQAVLLALEVNRRPAWSRGDRGFDGKWHRSDHLRMEEFMAKLRDGRRFNGRLAGV